MIDNSAIKLDENIDISKNDILYPLINGGFRIEIFGNNKVQFDGSYKIIEYTKETLRICKKKSNIIFTGLSLSISNLEKNSFLLTGIILNISFE